MSKRFVLVRNPGNSGGNWFMRISNLHDEILMVQELTQLLRISYCPKVGTHDPKIDFDVKIGQRRANKTCMFSSRTQCDIAYSFLIDQFYKRREEVIGLVKVFDTTVVNNLREEFGNEKVKVIQLVRNPAGIISYYTSQKTLRQTAYNETDDECFKGHVRFFSERFEGFVDRSKEGEEIIRLEDLNRSLKKKDDQFKVIMEGIFGVEWYDFLINDIIMNNDFGDAGEEALRSFQSWDSWKQEYFLQFFKTLTKEIGYEYR